MANRLAETSLEIMNGKNSSKSSETMGPNKLEATNPNNNVATNVNPVIDQALTESDGEFCEKLMKEICRWIGFVSNIDFIQEISSQLQQIWAKQLKQERCSQQIKTQKKQYL